ncbi:MAG: 50S ribosomal protein L5 [Verrucomicrobiae bacterium]|nr:50S ribosomal protein L5 [Verrucomicrobiae bacterium]
MEPTMLIKYKEVVAPGLKAKYNYANVHQIPRIVKVVLNSSFGRAEDRKAAAEIVMEDIATITGQRPAASYSKKAISNFKLRANEAIGAKVTLRGRNMWEFLDRFVNVAIPTIRDFRGVPYKSFDGRGNYTIGISDHSIFPEIELDKVRRTVGFDITVVTTASTDDEARDLLALMGMPFRKGGSQSSTPSPDGAEAEAA